MSIGILGTEGDVAVGAAAYGGVGGLADLAGDGGEGGGTGSDVLGEQVQDPGLHHDAVPRVLEGGC